MSSHVLRREGNQGQDWGGGESLYIEVQCIMGNGHIEPTPAQNG